MSDIDAKKIAELRSLLAKATLGPWSTHLVDDTTIMSPAREVATTCDSSQTDREDGYDIEYEQMEADAALIVAMRNAMPALLDLASHSLASASVEDGKLLRVIDETLQAMASQASVPMDLWDKHSNTVLSLMAHIRTLSAQLAEARRERDEAVNWNSIVDAHGDTFDDLASQWLAIDAIKHVTESISGVFKKWASADLLTRFQQHLTNGMHLSFVEGAVCGFRRAEARATASESEAAALREIIEDCSKALPNGAHVGRECSLDFMRRLPAEIAAVCARLISPEAAALRERVGVLEKALEPFAKAGEGAIKYRAGKPDDGGFSSILIGGKYDLTYGDLRRARTALEGRE